MMKAGFARNWDMSAGEVPYGMSPITANVDLGSEFPPPQPASTPATARTTERA
jgi:hypothetical protein